MHPGRDDGADGFQVHRLAGRCGGSDAVAPAAAADGGPPAGPPGQPPWARTILKQCPSPAAGPQSSRSLSAARKRYGNPAARTMKGCGHCFEIASRVRVFSRSGAVRATPPPPKHAAGISAAARVPHPRSSPGGRIRAEAPPAPEPRRLAQGEAHRGPPRRFDHRFDHTATGAAARANRVTPRDTARPGSWHRVNRIVAPHGQIRRRGAARRRPSTDRYEA